MEQIEGTSSAAVRFVKEVLRHHPPESVFLRRNKSGPMSLGEHGTVPKGSTVAMNFAQKMWSTAGSDFNPDYWTEQTSRDKFLTFGGHSPHSCVGRSIAMVELQLFARVLCREYDFEVLEGKEVRNWTFGGFSFMYKPKLRVRRK